MRYGHVNALNAALALLQDEEAEVRASAADFVRGLPDSDGKFRQSQSKHDIHKYQHWTPILLRIIAFIQPDYG